MASGRKKLSVSATSTSRSSRRPESKFVVCVANRDYPASLELHKIYRVLPDKQAERNGDLRVMDESGEDYLYPAAWFVAVDVPQAVKTSLLRRRNRDWLR
jgi:hypothetical protein